MLILIASNFSESHTILYGWPNVLKPGIIPPWTKMAISERSLKRVRDFFNTSIKVKHRFSSLKDFLEYANELEQAEFYDQHFDMIFVFLFECFLLMVSKTWILEELITEASSPRYCTFKFAFGVEVNEIYPDIQSASSSSTVQRVLFQCKRISPTNSAIKEKWFKDMKTKENEKKIKDGSEGNLKNLKEASKIENHLKFPIIFKTLLKFVSISRLMASPLAKLLILMIKRLLKEGNISLLRIEGLKMLLNFLKASSYEDKNEITEEFVKIFKSLVNLETFGIKHHQTEDNNNNNNIHDSNDSNDDTSTESRMPPLIREDLLDNVVLLGVSKDFEILNEIFAFITWDMNPDSHSTKFLYELLRDGYLSRIYPISYKAANTIYDINTNCDLNVRSDVQELVIDYLSLWLLKSETRRSFKFSRSSVLPTEDYLNGKRSESMVSLAVNDLTNLFGASRISSPREGSISRISYFSTKSPTLHDAAVASILLEEIILKESVDVVFIHLILRSALITLPFVSKTFSIKLVLEIFRSWLFNPPARRLEFLKPPGGIEKFLEFYLDSLGKLFPNKHQSILTTGEQDDDQLTLFDRLDIYKEVFYFFRAVALQVYTPLSLKGWIQMLKIEIEIADCLLQPENLLERPVFTSEDALITETVLGSLLRSVEHFQEEEMREIWIEVSAVLTRCSGCRGVIEEWCRIVETLALILVKDSQFTSHPSNQRLSRTNSNLNVNNIQSNSFSRLVRNNSNSFTVSTTSGSTNSLPPITASFSAWPDLPSVKSSSVLLFRNILRILGDPCDKAKDSNPEMIKIVFETLYRCTEIFLKCRANQTVLVPSTALPPLLDILPAALSCLLNLDYIKYDHAHILAYKILGRIMFRVDDLKIREKFWGALLLILKSSLDGKERLSVGQFTALLQFIGLPLTCVLIPGTTLILNELINSILRFYNDSLLWSTSLTATEADVLIPTTMKIIANALKLSNIQANMFSHFRDPECFLRIIKMFLNTLTDPKLIEIIYCSIAEIYCSECVLHGQDQDQFYDELLDMMLAPFKSSNIFMNTIVCVCDYISMLAHLKVSHAETNIKFPIYRILDALLTTLESIVYQPDLDLVVVQIVQGPLSDIILYTERGIIPADGGYNLKDRIFALFNANWSSKCAKAVIGMFAERLLTFSQVFPGPYGPSLVGFHDPSDSLENRKVFLQIAISPSSTLLSFLCVSSEADSSVFLICRNSIGKFLWKMQLIENGSDIDIKGETSESESNLTDFCFSKIVTNENFPLIRKNSGDKVVVAAEDGEEEEEFDLESNKRLKDFESQDALKHLLRYLKRTHPESLKKHTNYSIDLSSIEEQEEDLNWRKQCDCENKFLEKQISLVESRFVPSPRKIQPACSTQTTQLNCVRLLLSSFGINLPEMYSSGGIELLNLSGSIDDDLRSLDSISGRFCIKVGSLFIPTGVTSEADLLNNQNNRNTEEYFDFISALAIDPKVSDSRQNFGYSGGIGCENTNDYPYLPYLATPTYELIIHELDRLKGLDSGLDVKTHLGNDTVIICWHESNEDCVERSPLVSDLTTCIIRIRPHPRIPAWYCVTVQNCFERLVQPRKFVRLRTDPFVLKAENYIWQNEIATAASAASGTNNSVVNPLGIDINNLNANPLYEANLVQGRGVLVSKDLLGPMVRSLVVSAWKEANVIECIRSKIATLTNSTSQSQGSNTMSLDSERRVEFAPEMVRKARINEIIQRHSAGSSVPFDGFLSKLFSL